MKGLGRALNNLPLLVIAYGSINSTVSMRIPVIYTTEKICSVLIDVALCMARNCAYLAG